MIRRLLLSVALALLVLLPLDASAQPKPPSPSAPPPSQVLGDGLNLDKLVVIGVGVLVGVVAAEAIGGADAVQLLAGLAGGYLGAWWYESGDRVRIGVRQPTATSAVWSGGKLALAQ
jgi:hypothetical protein